ncbi:hypothetical protein PM082_007002 [Marasmius tenuissimus]|nr:hypothetical protein PM082_007002 [Marasmius tenuissimus]
MSSISSIHNYLKVQVPLRNQRLDLLVLADSLSPGTIPHLTNPFCPGSLTYLAASSKNGVSATSPLDEARRKAWA